MGWPVVIVPKGGIPVTEAANKLGAPVSVTTDKKRGVPITLVPKYGIPVVGAGGVVAWTPFDLGNLLVAWWDPQVGVSQSGGAVSGWTDRKGGLSATQSTSSQQPTLSPIINSRPALTFTGSALTRLVAPLVDGGVLANSAAVVVPANTTTADQRILANRAAGGADFGGAGYINFCVRANEATIGSFTNLTASPQTTAATFGQPLIAVEMHGAGTYLISGNGTASATSAFERPSYAAAEIVIGSIAWAGPPSAGESFTGSIGDVLIFSDALSGEDRQRVEGFLAWKYGLASALPADHPYKTAAPSVGA